MLFLSSTDFIARSAPLQLAPSAQDCQRDLTTKHTNRTARILETTKHTKAPLACQACVFLTQGRKSFSVAHLARKKNLSSESFFRKDADGAPSACLRRFSRVARSCTLRRTGTSPCSVSEHLQLTDDSQHSTANIPCFNARTLSLGPSRNSALGRCCFAVSPPSMPTNR